jgi:uncharacterized protein YjiS (DUF1127 family)
MFDHDIDSLALDYRRLTPRQKDTYRRLVIRRAEAARGEVVRNALRTLWTGLRSLAVGSWTAYQARRRQRLAAAELSGLDDRTLRDLGISRSEIVSLVRDGSRDPTRRRDVPPPTARAA